MPRNDNCNHPNCYGQPCKQLTDEELAPTEADIVFAREIIEDGWKSTSNRYRTVSNLPANFPLPSQVVPANLVGTKHAVDLMKLWDSHRRSSLRANDSINMVLTVKQWAAFKALGGESA